MIVFRVDSSSQIGSGHLMRCLTLAHRFKARESVAFIVRDLEGNLNSLIQEAGFFAYVLPRAAVAQDALAGYQAWLTVRQERDAQETAAVLSMLSVSLLVVDSYAIDETWEKSIRSLVKKILVIDDLANRRHDCDVLLDQNYCSNMLERYTGLVPQKCKLFLGPKYVLLREEFYQERKKLRSRAERLKNILVFFGGSDLTNETMKTLRALAGMTSHSFCIYVVVGGANSHAAEVESFCKTQENMHYFYQISNMAELMGWADLAIGAGGTTTWERCFLGLPALVIAIADNQKKIVQECAKEGVIVYLGVAAEVTEDDICAALEGLCDKKLLDMQQAACCLEVAGNGWIESLFASGDA